MPTCNFINMDDDTDVVHISLTLAKHKTNTRLNNPSYPVNVQLTFSFDYCSEKLIHTMQLGKIQVWMAIVGMFLVTVSHAMGNGGTIEGTVVDAASGSPIDGATVSLLGTAQATVSASDGSFRLAGIQKGAYTLHVSYLGYVEARLGVAVAVGEASTVKVGLEASGEVMDEIVITTARSRGSDLALLAERHQSNLAVEKIGAQELARKGVADVAGAVTKMSGISRQEGSSQIYVRGLGDRYNSTSLNGLPLPSNDPEQKNIALDLFSTDIVEFISMDKVYHNRISGDFGGGNVDISSKDYSGPGMFELTVGSTANTNALGEAARFQLHRGPNVMGFTRYSLPNDPLRGFHFQNRMNTQARSPLPGSIAIRGGKSVYFGSEKRLNAFATAKFSNGYQYRRGVNGNFSAQGARIQELDQERFSYETITTAMVNLNFIMNPNNRVAHNFMFINSSEQANDIFRGFIRDIAENDNGFVQRGTYTQNKLFVEQFLGKHRLNQQLELDWGLSATQVVGEMPDRIQNTLRAINAAGDYVLAQNTTTDNHRYNQRLHEQEYALNMGAAYRIGGPDEPRGIVRMGYSGRLKNRDFEAIQFNFRVMGPQLNTVVDPFNLDAFFNAENYQAGYFAIGAFAGETPQTYAGEQHIHAGYAGIEYSLTDRLTTVIGLRYENIRQAVRWQTQLDDQRRNNTFRRNALLPNLSLRYALRDDQNLRLGASKTYTLPQFKERALFVYEDVTEKKTGNPDLYPSQNYNLDLKWELFPSATELVSVTAFGKYILDPINETIVASSTNDISFINTGEAGTVMGIELEIRKNILDLEQGRDVLSGGFNAAYMQTSQDLDSEKVAAETRHHINLTDTRSSFTGASDWLVNADLTYTLRWNNNASLMATLAYSYFSDRIYSLGVETKGNLVDRGVGTLDVILSSKLNRKLGIDLIARNLSDPTYRRVQENASGHIPVLSYKKGQFYTVSLKYSF